MSRNTIVATFVAIAMAIVAGLATAQETVILNADSIENVKLSWGGQIPDSRMELNTDKEFVSEGQGSIHVFSVTQPDAKGNSYVGFRAPVKPTDLKGKGLMLDAWSAHPKTTKALYVRGYNARGKCVASWQCWKHPLSKTCKTIGLVPGKQSSDFAWEPKKIQAAGDPIAFIECIAGSPTKGDPFDLYIDNVRVAPAANIKVASAPKPAPKPAAKPKPALPKTVSKATMDALLAGETIDGIVITTGAGAPGTKLELNTNPDFVSQGKGSTHLMGKKPADSKKGKSAYVAMDIPLAGVSLKGQSIKIDAWSSHPAATKGFYVRGYAADGKCAVSWASWGADAFWKQGKKTIEATPNSSGDMSWEAHEIKTKDLSSIVKLRVYIGTRDPGAEFDVYLDNIRFVKATTQSFLDVDKAAPLYPDTAIVQNGKAVAVIVTPADAQWRALGKELAGDIAKAAGAAPAVKTSDEIADADLHETNAIVLGSVVNNRRLLYSYSHRQMFADDLYPGAGGYDVRSLHDPWGTGKNIISIGASDIAGARAGVEVLKKKLNAKNGSLTFTRMLEARLTGEADTRWTHQFERDPGPKYLDRQKKAAESGLKAGVHTGLFGQARNAGLLYALTRKPEYAQAFVWLIKRAKTHHDSKPTTYGGPWGMDSDFTIYGVMPAWDEVEEDPGLTDEERLAVSRILFEWVGDMSPKGRASGKRVRFNHQTFPALGLMYAGHYFVNHYKSGQAKKWLEYAAITFDLQLKTTKPHCDCNTYQWLTLYHTTLYSLATQNLTYFENGNCARTVDYAIHTMNNLGYQVAYGDIGGWGPIGNEMVIMRAAEWYYRNGRALWAIDKKLQVTKNMGLTQFTTQQAQPVMPNDLIGASIWAVPKMWYDSFLTATGIDLPRTVDKVIFRNGFDPDDQYLLLDGLSVGGHRHMDGNAILGWSENNRIWLADGDYIKALPKFHNGVLVLRDGQSAQIPAAVELMGFTDMPAVAVSRTAMHNYAGADWTRNIVWLKGRGFVVLDRMQAQTDGEFSFRTVWQTVGEVTHDGAALGIDQKGEYARFAMSQDTPTLLQDDPALGKNWASYPHARDPIIRVFQGIVTRDMKKGDTADLFTALHASGDKPSEAKVLRVSPHAAVVTGTGEPVLIAAPMAAGDAVLPGIISGDAALFVVTPSHITAVGATRLAVLGNTQTYSVPTDVEIEIAGLKRTTSPTVLTTDAKPYPKMDTLKATGSFPDIQKSILALLDKAAPPAKAAAAGPQAPAIQPLWNYASIPDRFLLTNNAGAFGAIDTGVTYSCSPQPLSANVFSQEEGANTLDLAFNGQELGTSGAVMWDNDQEVTVNVDFAKPCDVSAILLKHWFAVTSSKNKLFQLGRLRILASNDGFASDKREIVDFKDTETHPSWGSPIRCPFDNLDFQAKNLRFILTPRPGTAIYIAELEVWGKPGDLNVKTATTDMLDAFACVDAADLDGDGKDEVVAGAESGYVYCLNADGSLRWNHNTTGAIYDIAAVDFAGDGKRWVVVGRQGGVVHAFDAQGNEKWTFEMPAYKKTGNVHVIFPADIAGNGKQIAMAGADNWRYYALDASGKEIWHYESVHPSTAGAAIDVDGDGKDELALGTAYYWWHLVNPDGSRRWDYRTKGGPGATAVTGGDITGDAKPEVLFGGEDAFVQVVGADGKALWQFNTGDEVTGLATANVGGSTKKEILASSLSFNVYCISGENKVVWRRDLGAPVRSSAVFPDTPLMAAGCDNGMFYVLDASRQGKALGMMDTGGRIVDMVPARIGGQAVFILAGKNGYLRAVPAK